MELSIPVPVPEFPNVIPAHPWNHPKDNFYKIAWSLPRQLGETSLLIDPTLTLAVLATTAKSVQRASCSVNPTKPNKISNLGFFFWVFAAWPPFLIWPHFELHLSGMMTVLRLLLVLCAVPPPSNSIKCFTCIGSVSFESWLWTRSQGDFRFSVHLPQAAHVLEHPRWERERMPSGCQLLRTQVQYSLLLLDRKLSFAFVQVLLLYAIFKRKP